MRTFALLAAVLLAEWFPLLLCFAVLGLLVWLLPWWAWAGMGGATALVLVFGYLLRRRSEDDGDVSE